MPDFLGMKEEIFKDLQSDAEIMGTDFIQSNFDKQGFTDAAFEAWQPKKQSDTYNILKVTNELYKSINVSESSPERIVWQADAPYAEIHNNGGSLTIPITRKARKFFWYMFKATGKDKWKWMALSKKESFTFKMDKRQFMGDSQTFRNDWHNHVVGEIQTRFKQT